MSGTQFDDPNRESLGLAPIWEGDHDTEPVPEPEPKEESLYDPGAHSVADVETYVAEHPDERAAVLAAEIAGKNRTTLVAALSEGDAGVG